MRLTICFTLACTLFLTACATSQQETETAASSPATPVSYHYVCESGETVAVAYHDPNSARMDYQGTTHDMQIAVSGSGARYVGGGLEWWTKGSGEGSQGILFQHNADDTTGELIDSCTAE